MSVVPCSGDCGFLAANLYAKSVFGEDALVNLSVEKGADGKLSGYIRIRCEPACILCLACGGSCPQHDDFAHAASPSVTGAAEEFSGFTHA